ncbi:MAG: hypothetical protein LUO93_10970, partial [Methanomicrobiales archaeon]|nr:hypothetical protein [Methanomicrobiales archaeon]
LMTQAVKDAEEALKKDRAEMHKRNIAHMEALAKIIPTPTIEEVQRALAGRAFKPTPAPPPVEKVSEPEPTQAEHRGSYKTRDARAKKDE